LCRAGDARNLGKNGGLGCTAHPKTATSMSNGGKSEPKPRTQAEIRRERLAAELRSNLHKRKQQARGRVAAARQVDKQNSSD
jgi:hypothetical protein